MPRVLAVNGSYREDGITDQALTAISAALAKKHVDVETIRLRERPIEFCLNCRACTQEPGAAPGQCVHDDAMRDIVDKIEAADAYVLAAPTNFGSVTAGFKRFLERLTVYGYWPWGAPAPVYRKRKQPKKPALLVTSCAAPAVLGRLMYSSTKQLRTAAELIGAKPVGVLTTGMISSAPDVQLPRRQRRRAKRLAERLL